MKKIVLRFACMIGDGSQSYIKEVFWQFPHIPRVGESVIIDDFSSLYPLEVWGVTFNAVDSEVWLHVCFDGSEITDKKVSDEFAEKMMASGWTQDWKTNT